MSGIGLLNPFNFLVRFMVQNFLVTKVATNATSIALAKPSGVVEGNLMVAFVAKDGGNAITPPAGWSTIKDGGSAGGLMRFVSYWKEAGASETGPYTFTGDSQQWIGSIVRITGHEAGDPINAAHFLDENGAPDTTPVCPDIPTWADDCIVLRAFGADDDDITIGGGYPAGLTGQYDDQSNTGSGTCSTGLANKDQAIKGATGTASFALTDAEEWVAMTIAISKKGAASQWPGNYFGSGADGAHTVTTAEQLTATLDGSPVIKHYSSLTINSGKSLTTNNRCKGLVVYVTGDCTINGALNMDSRGAKFDSIADFGLSRFEPGGGGGGTVANALLADESNQPLGGGGSAVFTRYKSRNPGAAGGATQSTVGANGNPGTAGGFNQTGGGGGGGVGQDGSAADGGSGSRGTTYSGGTGGGGGAVSAGSSSGTAATTNGGAGGIGGNGDAIDPRGGGGGGAGNSGGAGGSGGGGAPNGSAGTNGSGGLLFLIVGGNLTIGAGGIISCDGGAGGAGGSATGQNGAGGGGSGGGRLIVLYKGTLNNTGTVRANGGTAGAKGSGSGGAAGDGGAGGAGAVTGPTQVV